MSRVIIVAGSRLHLGFYNIKNPTTAYGSIGVYVEEPRTLVELERASSTSLHGPLSSSEKRMLESIVDLYCSQTNVSGVRVKVTHHPPRHVGLGSTTQLLLSIATGIARMCGKRAMVARLALLLKRGLVSGIGIYGFWRGGFIVDSGRRCLDNMLKPPSRLSDLPRLLFRARIPSSWRFVLIIPEGVRGLKEEEEESMITKPPSVDNDVSTTLLQALLSKVVRGVIDLDLKLFGEGINTIQDLVGDAFSVYQGGRYATPFTERAVEILRGSGAAGAGQSSWGPLAYGIFKARGLEEVLRVLRRRLYHENIDARIVATHARNRGFSLHVESPPSR
uniref:Beta-ribofuranosylaminobenzene 5'-phosphate synthase n=1 Tax=Fervidicoccus fontis TaxID=683846 RepID=A0A7J3ZJ31_9CREN